MRKFSFKAAAAALLLTAGIMAAPMSHLHADVTTYGTVKVEYVESIDNMQYPSTDKYWGINDFEGYMSFTINEPTMVKTYIKWDGDSTSGCTLEYAKDRGGLDIVGESKELRNSGDHIIHLLDAGTYYVHYKFKSTTQEGMYSVTAAGICVLGQKLGSTEQIPVSSFSSPNTLSEGTAIKGALSVTSPIDYYKVVIKETGTIKISYNFDTFNDFSNSYGAQCVLYDSDKNMLETRQFSTYSSSENVLEKELEKGTYYITLSGAETSTTLKYTFTKKTEEEQIKASYGTAKVSYVTSIDNALYPATSQFTSGKGTEGTRKFTIKKPTIIKAYMTWDTNTFYSVDVWFSRDKNGMDKIGDKVTLSPSEPYIIHLFDKGTYYVNYSLSGGFNLTGEEVTGICLVGQKVKTSEKVAVSSFKEPTLLKSGKKKTGFLSVTAPVDYYKFVLDEESNVTFQFNFATIDGKMPYGGKFTLYSGSKEYISARDFDSYGSENNKFTLHLKKGTYFVTLSGWETYTTLKYSAKSTNVKIKQYKQDNGSVKLYLKSETYFKEILMREGKEAKGTINDYGKWNAYADKCTALDGKTTYVKKNGWYTFRVQDDLENYYIWTVKVTDCK